MNTEESVLSAVLRGDETRWPYTDDQAAQAFLDAVARHGIQPLVARQIRRGVLIDAPASVQHSLHHLALQHAAVELGLAAEVRRVVDRLASASVPVLLMKGTALAYSHYPHPCLRPRTDTDLLLRPCDVAKAARVFEALGYEPLNMTRGDFVLYQRSYARTDRLGVRQVYDVHWKVAGPQSVSESLGWEELDQAARSIAALGEHARALGDIHALLLACVHRMAHHYDNRRLIWLYDIHVLASRLGEESLRALMHQSVEKGVASMCIHGLELARERFGTRLPGDFESYRAVGLEASASRFGSDVRMVDILVSDLKALPGWRERLRLLREHVFPPVDYIRRRYGISSTLALPVLYAHRFLTGVLKWLRPAGAADPFA